jgi:hypothetical protein
MGPEEVAPAEVRVGVAVGPTAAVGLAAGTEVAQYPHGEVTKGFGRTGSRRVAGTTRRIRLENGLQTSNAMTVLPCRTTSPAASCIGR